MNPDGLHSGELTRDQFARVRELFDRAYDLPPQERIALLDRECRGNLAMRQCVHDLLAADDTAGGAGPAAPSGLARQLLEPLDTPATPCSDRAPDQIGPYRIRRVIGEGAMGTVYLAEQRNPHREVALKLMRAGPGSRTLISRFGREIRVLGRLEHPGIARIYEAGSTQSVEGSLSYFAMEYIRGPRLNDFVASENLDTPAVLELVARIADAVQHAHTKGVIHRDLKPANILVSPQETIPPPGATAHAQQQGAQPKILDFGVARFTEPDTQHTALSEHGVLVGTVAYMSPEQLGGDADAVDARTDVYAIGVILFELLTGRLPHDVRSKPIPEAARIVRDDEPSPLNTPARPGRPPFDRDLQNIVARAIAKDRERRYPTAAALADDLRRYLHHEPILARPATAYYHLSKFARRHRGLVTGSIIALAALVTGLVASIGLYLHAESQRRIAESQRLRADSKEQLGASLLGYLIDDVLKAASPDRLGDNATVLEALLSARDGLHDRFERQPEVEATVRASLAEVLDALGRLDEGDAEWVAAINLLERTHGPDHERTIATLLDRAISSIVAQRHQEGGALAMEALTRARRALPSDHPLTIQALTQVGRALSNQGQFAAALTHYKEALSLAEHALQRDEPRVLALKEAVMVSEHSRKDRDPQVMARLNREMFDLAMTLPPEDPQKAAFLTGIMVDHARFGNIADALAIAPALPDLIEQSIPPAKRGFTYRRLTTVYRAARQFEQAAHFALLCHDSFSILYKNLSSQNEWCAETLVAIYSEWPGHDEQVREWRTRLVGIHLMLAPAGQVPSIINRLLGLRDAVNASGQAVTEGDCLDLIWRQRDDLSPPGHGRRAAFFANFALVAAAIDHRGHFDEALDLATAALPDSVNAGAVAGLIAAASAQTR